MRPFIAIVVLLPLLGACASPCERIDDDFRELSADMIRNPAILMDGSYKKQFQELAAQSVENQCLR